VNFTSLIKPGVEEFFERRKQMNLFNFIVWLSTGAVIGWFASRMVQAEQRRSIKPVASSDSNSTSK
jgi:hypothetical protein